MRVQGSAGEGYNAHGAKEGPSPEAEERSILDQSENSQEPLQMQQGAVQQAELPMPPSPQPHQQQQQQEMPVPQRDFMANPNVVHPSAQAQAVPQQQRQGRPVAPVSAAGKGNVEMTTLLESLYETVPADLKPTVQAIQERRQSQQLSKAETFRQLNAHFTNHTIDRAYSHAQQRAMLQYQQQPSQMPHSKGAHAPSAAKMPQYQQQKHVQVGQGMDANLYLRIAFQQPLTQDQREALEAEKSRSSSLDEFRARLMQSGVLGPSFVQQVESMYYQRMQQHRQQQQSYQQAQTQPSHHHHQQQQQEALYQKAREKYILSKVHEVAQRQNQQPFMHMSQAEVRQKAAQEFDNFPYEQKLKWVQEYSRWLERTQQAQQQQHMGQPMRGTAYVSSQRAPQPQHQAMMVQQQARSNAAEQYLQQQQQHHSPYHVPQPEYTARQMPHMQHQKGSPQSQTLHQQHYPNIQRQQQQEQQRHHQQQQQQQQQHDHAEGYFGMATFEQTTEQGQRELIPQDVQLARGNAMAARELWTMELERAVRRRMEGRKKGLRSMGVERADGKVYEVIQEALQLRIRQVVEGAESVRRRRLGQAGPNFPTTKVTSDPRSRVRAINAKLRKEEEERKERERAERLERQKSGESGQQEAERANEALASENQHKGAATALSRELGAPQTFEEKWRQLWHRQAATATGPDGSDQGGGEEKEGGSSGAADRRLTLWDCRLALSTDARSLASVTKLDARISRQSSG